jgi:hypothetical protein
MKIPVVTLHADGTQTLEQIEVPENYLDAPELSPEASQSADA